MVLPYIEKPYFCQELHFIEFSRIFSLTHISKKTVSFFGLLVLPKNIR